MTKDEYAFLVNWRLVTERLSLSMLCAQRVTQLRELVGIEGKGELCQPAPRVTSTDRDDRELYRLTRHHDGGFLCGMAGRITGGRGEKNAVSVGENSLVGLAAREPQGKRMH